MAKIGPVQFLRQVRQEIAKVTWPARRETAVSTGLVFVMVIVAAVFFLVIDQVFAWAVKAIFGLGA